MQKYIQVLTTVSKKKEAEKIASVIILKQLGVCVQIIGPITSVYRWNGKVEKAREFLCLIKTKKSLYKKLAKLIKELHSYETPEIIATPIIDGDKDYLRWMEQATS